MLDAATLPLESNVALALVHDAGGENDRKLIAPAIAAYVNLHGRPELAAAEASREAGNAPNAVLAAAAAIVGPKRQQAARAALKFMLERFHAAGLGTEFGAALNESFDIGKVDASDAARAQRPTRAMRVREALIAGVQARGARSVFLRWLQSRPGHPTEAAVLAAISATLAWGPLSRKRISLLTARELPVVAAALRHADRRFGRGRAARGRTLLRHRASDRCSAALSLGEIAFAALLGRTPGETDLFAFQTLVGLLLTNGPGAISAQGAKGAVSADGPEQPERVQLNKALVGFLTHTGYAHGGNGYEGIAYLIEQFKASGLKDPSAKDHGIDLKALAARAVDAVRAVQEPEEDRGQPRHRQAARREPSGVQGQAGQLRSARGVHREAVRKRAATATCSTTSIARWCSSSSTPASRATSTA